MPKILPKNVPDELKALYKMAREHNIDPTNFCRELEEKGITGVKKLPHVLEAFNLSFGEAKDIVITYDTGSTEKWAEDMSSVVEGVRLTV